MQVLKSLTSLSEFSSKPYYREKIIGSDSSPGYMHEVNVKMWPSQWVIKNNLQLYWISTATCHLENINQFGMTLVHMQTFLRYSTGTLPVIHSTVVCIALCSAFLLSDESFSSLQEPGCSRPRLLLFGPAEVCASCSLHCAGYCSALPSLHMERFFTQITVWVHAPTADCRSLSLLQHYGPKPQFQ